MPSRSDLPGRRQTTRGLLRPSGVTSGSGWHAGRHHPRARVSPRERKTVWSTSPGARIICRVTPGRGEPPGPPSPRGLGITLGSGRPRRNDITKGPYFRSHVAAALPTTRAPEGEGEAITTGPAGHPGRGRPRRPTCTQGLVRKVTLTSTQRAQESGHPIG